MAKMNLGRFAEHYRRQAYVKKATAGTVIQNAWRNYASKELSGGRTKTEYLSNIQLDLNDPKKIVVRLVGFLPNMRERGMGPDGIGSQGPYDVRKFLLRPGTSKIKRAKAGHLYLHVPFDHSFSSMPSRVQSAVGSQSIGSALRAFAPSTSQPRTGTTWGDRLPAGLVGKMREKDVRMRDHFGRYTKFIQRAHATDRYAGMVKMGKQYSTANQSTHRTWRTTSQAGKPWYSKGVRAAHIARKVVRDLPMILKRAGLF